MAARKPQAKAEDITPEATEPEAKAEDVTPAETPKPEAPEKGAGKMVLVRNKARFDYVQPSTGIKIYVNSSEPTKVLADGWVEQFVDAGLLERA